MNELIGDRYRKALCRAMALGMRWVSVDERMPPDEWFGLVLTNMRPDAPVTAHRSTEWHRREFPFADPFLGNWREAVLIADAYRDRLKVTHWLEGFEIPKLPENQDSEVGKITITKP